MAIYRPQRPRWRLALWTGLLGLAVGLLVGWGLLRPEPDPAQVLGDVRSSLVSAAATLEVVEVEYAESVEDGEVVAAAEYEGARGAIASSRQRYDEVRRAVDAIAPETGAAIEDAYGRLEAAVDEQAPEEEVAAIVQELSLLLDSALGG